jgi:hypothetical protein
MSKAQATERARHLLDLVGLTGFEDKRPSELSGGMRQRASLCRSIIHKPDVLILDEPFGALDAFTREDLWCTMHDLRAQEPFTCMLITHDLRESVFLADQVVVLSGRPAHTQYVLDVDMPGEAASWTTSTRPKPWKCWQSCATRSRSPRAARKMRLPPLARPRATGERQTPTHPGGDAMNDTTRKILAPMSVHRGHHRRSGNGRCGYNDLPDFRMASPSDLIPQLHPVSGTCF